MATITEKLDSEIDLDQANGILEGLCACERIRWAHSFARGRLVATTSGGRTSRILPHLVSGALGYSIPTIFVDTGHYPTETYQFIAEMYADGIDLRFYGASMSPELLKAVHGDLWNRDGMDFDLFLEMVKHRPLNQAFEDLKPRVWVRGIMGFQTEQRRRQQILEYRNGLYRLHPMLDWSRERMESYLNEHQIQINQGHYDVTKGPGFKNECKIGNRCGFIDGEGI